MVSTRFEAALRVAEGEISVLLAPLSETNEKRNTVAMQILNYVLQNGPWPTLNDEPDQQFVLETAYGAIRKGLVHAYGDGHKGKIDPTIIERLQNIADKLLL